VTAADERSAERGCPQHRSERNTAETGIDAE
jgi:hypothetical protein